MSMRNKTALSLEFLFWRTAAVPVASAFMKMFQIYKLLFLNPFRNDKF